MPGIYSQFEGCPSYILVTALTKLCGTYNYV